MAPGRIRTTHIKAEYALRDHPIWALAASAAVRAAGPGPRQDFRGAAAGRQVGPAVDLRPDLLAEDVAPGYKNLVEADRGLRDLKSTLELRTGVPPDRSGRRPALLARAPADQRRRTTHRTHLATLRPRARPVRAVIVTGTAGNVVQTTLLSEAASARRVTRPWPSPPWTGPDLYVSPTAGHDGPSAHADPEPARHPSNNRGIRAAARLPSPEHLVVALVGRLVPAAT